MVSKTKSCKRKKKDKLLLAHLPTKDQISGKVIPIIPPSKIAPILFLYIHDILQMPYPERLLSRLCQIQGQFNCLLNFSAAKIALFHEFTVVFIAERFCFPETPCRKSANSSLEDGTFAFPVWLIVFLDKIDPRLVCLIKCLYPSLALCGMQQYVVIVFRAYCSTYPDGIAC